MTQSIYLAVDPEGKKLFDCDKLRQSIRSLDGIIEWREADDKIAGTVLYECDVNRAKKEVTIAVFRDRQCLTIDYTLFGLEIALEIQHAYGEPIVAFTEGSSPDMIPLTSVGTSTDLAERLKAKE